MISFNQLNDTSQQKQEEVLKTTARKKALSNNGLPVSTEDFVLLYPNATPDDLQRFQVTTQQNQFNKSALAQATARNNENNNPYTFGELIGDTANSVAKAPLALSEILYGVADFASRNNLASKGYELFNQFTADTPQEQIAPDRLGSLDSLTGGFSKNFQESRDVLDSIFQSDNQAIDQRRIQENQNEFNTQVDKQTQTNIEAGNNEWVETAKSISKKAVNTAEQYLNNPGVVLQQVIEEIPQMMTGGAAAKIGINLLTKGMTEAVAKRFLKSKAGKEKLTQIANTAGVGTAALSEAMSNAVQTKAEILNLSEKELAETSPAYAELRAAKLTHEEARMRLSDNAFDIVAAMTLPLAGLTSKVTGAANLEGTMFIPNSKLAKSFTKVMAAAGIEGLEEGIQGGVGQIAQNLGKQQTVDPTQSLTKGVGDAIGQGAVIGAGAGLTLTGITSAPEILVASSEDVKKTITAASDVIKTGAKKLAKLTDSPAVKAAKETKDSSAVTDTTSETYSPDDALRTLTSKDFFPIKNEAEGETQAAFDIRAEQYRQELQKHFANKVTATQKEGKDNPSPDKSAINEVRAYGELIAGLKNLVGKSDYDSIIKSIKDNGDNQEAKEVILGSMSDGFLSNVTEKQAEELISTGTLSTKEEAKVKSYIELRKVQSEVSSDIKNGGKGFFGLADYNTSIHASVDANNPDATRSSLQALATFAKAQVEKNKILSDAFKLANQTGEEQNVKVGDKSYNITSKSDNGANGLITAVRNDTKAVVDTFNSLRDYAATAFTQNVTEDIDNVRATSTKSTERTDDNSERSEPVTRTPSSDASGSRNNNQDTSSTGTTDRQDAVASVRPETNDNALINKVNSNEESIDAQRQPSQNRETSSIQSDAVTQQAEETVEEATESTGTTDTGGEQSVDDTGTTTSGLSEGRAYGNRLTKLFSIKKIKNIINGTTDLFNELDTVEGLTDVEKEALSNIAKFKEAMVLAIDKIIGLKPLLDGENPYAAVDKNMIQLLMQDGVDNLGQGLDPNVLNTMAVVGLKWAATRGNETLKRTPQDIADMLGLNNKDLVPDHVMQYYLEKGIPSYLITDNLGTDVVSALGLKVRDSAPRETRNRMAQSIGGVIFAALHELDILQSETAENLPNILGDDESEDSLQQNREGNGKSLRMTKLKNSPATQKAISYFDNIAEKLEDIFTVFNEFSLPSFTPPDSVPEKNNKGTQDLTKTQKEALRKYANRAFKMDTKTVEMFLTLGDDFLRDVMGYDFSVKLNNEGKLTSKRTHVSRLYGAQGKNNAIDRSIENLNKFVEHLQNEGTGTDQEFFFESVVDNNNRFRINNKLVNPQGDKLHRAAMVMDGWDYDVNDERTRGLFKLAVGQALGIDIDKLTIEDSITEINELLNGTGLHSQVIREGVNALRNLKNNPSLDKDTADTERRKVRKALRFSEKSPYFINNKSKSRAHALSGLIALMDYTESGSFTSNLAIEVDGITNGTALALLQFAAGSNIELDETLAKTGIYTDGTSSFGEWKKDKSNLDNYESLSVALQRHLNSIITPQTDKRGNSINVATNKKGEEFTAKQVAAMRPIGNILGKLKYEGDDDFGLVRSVAKNPVMIGNYGAGDKKVTAEFVEEVVNRIYEHIEDAVYAKDSAQLVLLQNELETVVGKLPKLTLQNGMNWQLPPKQLKSFKGLVNSTFGEIMGMALNEEFEEIRTERDSFNVMINATNALYRAAYEVEAKKLIDEKGFISIGDEKLLKRKLAKYLPEIKHGQVGAQDGMNTHIPVQSTKLDVNRSARFSTEIDFKEAPKNHPNVKQRQVYSPELINTSNGAKGTVFGIQSTDSAIMVENLLADYPSVNIYDAVIVSPVDLITAASTLNKATIEVSKKTPLYRSVAENLKRALKGYPAEYRKLAQFYLIEELEKGLVEGQNPMDLVKAAMANTNLVEARRKDLFKRIKNTNQYYWEGGDHKTNQEPKSNETLVNDFVAEVKANTDSLGSAPGGNTSYSAGMVEHNLISSTITGLMTLLRGIGTVKSSTTHAQWLDSLVGDLYNGLITPLKLKVGQSTRINSGVYNPNTKEILVNVNTGLAQSGMEMGADEVLAHEVVHAIIKSGLESNSLLAREIRKLMIQAKKVITPDDLRNPSDSAQEAQKRWNYIFNNPKLTKGGYSVGVHEFVAFGVTNEKFIAALSKATPNAIDDLDTTTLFGKIKALYSRFIQLFAERITGVKNLTADKKLVELVRQLAETEARSQQVAYKARFTNRLEKGINSALIKYIQEPLINFLNKDVFTKPSDSRVLDLVQALAAAGRITAKGEFGEFNKVINKVATRLGATENNIFIAILNEIQGRTDENNYAYNLARESRKLIDQARADIATNVKQHLIKKYSRALTEDEETSLTKVLLKLDLSSLLDKYNTEELYQILTDTNFLNKKIVETEKDLQKFGNDKVWFIKQAKSLGNFIVTGKFLEGFGLLNAHAIASRVGTGKRVPNNISQSKPLIDRLATLSGISTMNKVDPVAMATTVKIFKEEFLSDPNDNGIIFTLLMHNDYKQRSKEKLFGNNPMTMVKGYIREIYNPNKSFVVAPEADAILMGKDGFTRIGGVPKDTADPNNLPMAMYINNVSTLAPWQAGGVSIAGMTAKGTKYFNTVSQHGVPNPHQVISSQVTTVRNRKQNTADAIYNGRTVAREQVGLVPLLDEQGNVADFRYMMEESTKGLLDRNIRITDVLGAMEGNFKSKLSGNEINSKYVDAMVADFRENYSKDPERYVFVGLGSTRTDLEELYRMMPIAMREEIKAATGQDGIFVKRELVKVIFGQRKFSVPHYFREKIKLREVNGITTNMYMERVYRILGSSRVAGIEQGWQEIIKIVKDTIVVKAVSTLLGNIGSNNLLLWSLGLPIKDIAVNQEKAIRFAEEYEANKSRLAEIVREIAVNKQQANTVNRRALIANLEAESAKLQDAQVTNPVHDLIEAGVYQSIIEDVDMLDDEFTYKSKIEEWISPVTDKIPTLIKTVASNVALTQDTKLYQILRRSTQLSDFAARFALHEHNLKSGMDSAKSINMIVDTFIDYDLPTHKGIEYLNSIGGVFFTKFFLRIQKIILNTLTTAPARALGLFWIQELFGEVSDILDSSVMFDDIGYKFKDPLEALMGIVDTHPVAQLLK